MKNYAQIIMGCFLVGVPAGVVGCYVISQIPGDKTMAEMIFGLMVGLTFAAGMAVKRA